MTVWNNMLAVVRPVYHYAIAPVGYVIIFLLFVAAKPPGDEPGFDPDSHGPALVLLHLVLFVVFVTVAFFVIMQIPTVIKILF
ncbi:MAG: hypothetical protein U9N14_00010 [Pseudomonadota bacterium]|nr:hypothetical protein [Pseudomonadota bacterium]